MMNSPVEQISESQRLTPQLHVEPEAKGMQGHFGGQACLKAIQSMRALTSQAKGIEQLVINGLNDLAQSSQKAPPGFGPAHFTVLMRRADDLRAAVREPVAMQPIACKAFVCHIDALCRRADALQTWRGIPPRG